MLRPFLLPIATVLGLAAGGYAHATEPEIMVLTSTEDAEGATQADFSTPLLKALEKRTVQQLETKTRDWLKANGHSTPLPKFESQSHYVEAQGTKLAIVRVSVPKAVNQVFAFGIKGDTFVRVGCARTRNFDQAIPLFYGPCGERIREVFGVSIGAR